MDNYWNERYKSGGNSGAGSYDEYAKHKSAVINEIIEDYEIKTISDFGCGDGNQIGMFVGFEKYSAYDISEYILDVCRERYKNNNKIKFYNKIDDLPESDLCLSLDVLYHIIDQYEYETYLNKLFQKSNKYVMIFSTNTNNNGGEGNHILHRKFTDWVGIYYQNFKLIEEIDNSLKTSAKFFLYKKESI